MMKHIQIVLKTVERCNINCRYCYMFNMGDQTYLKRPAFISHETIDAIALFLKEGCLALNADALTIEFHGGEPLLQKKKDFIYACETFNRVLRPFVKLNYMLQTNAMLIDEAWLDIFYQYNIGVGVSIDGPKEYHDIYRQDKQGRGTYDRVIAGVKQLKGSQKMQELGNFGVLCVINPQTNARDIYRHFVDEIGASCIDFLLPHLTHDEPMPFPPIAYGKFLCELFDEWVLDNDPDIYIRFFHSTLNEFTGGYSYVYGVGPRPMDEIPLLCITTNGEITPTDELRAIGSEIIYNGLTVFNTLLDQYLTQHPLFSQLESAQMQLPAACQSCCWKQICAGGSMVSRFSQSNSFNNPSIYCEGLKQFYSHVASYLLNNGFGAEKLMKALSLNA
jgi:uncharacterized protein